MRSVFFKFFIDLELHDGVSEGKYLLGLGQEKMAVCAPVEDAISMSLNAFSRLISRFQISVDQIGRIDVGSESNPDRAKSIKSHLISLLGDKGSNCIAGGDNLQACYGGTAALLNSAAWLESSQWEPNKFAIVVAGDVAIYDSPSARATGGAGAVAILLARDSNASIKLDKHFGHYSTHVYDFYKPDPSTEAPKVDGPLSISSYLLSACNAYINWYKRAHPSALKTNPSPISYLFSNLIFHSPYSKIVFKAFRRLQAIDHLDFVDMKDFSSAQKDHISRTNFETDFSEIVEPNLKYSKQIGNAYCSSIFFNLICALSRFETGKIGAFSYGSGSMATFFSFSFDGRKLDWLQDLISDLESKLSNRTKITPLEYEKLMKKRKGLYGASNWTANSEDIKHLREGSFYLNRIDSEFRRHYQIKQPNQSIKDE